RALLPIHAASASGDHQRMMLHKTTRPTRLALALALALAFLAGAALRYARPAEAAPAPSISSVSPALGPSVGGTTITIVGTGFVAGATVTVGGAPATGVIVGSSTTIIATTPAGAPGAALVTVTNTDTQSTTLASAFTYQHPAPTFASMLP